MDNDSANLSNKVSKSEKNKNSTSKILSSIGVIACIILLPILLLNIYLIIQGFTTDDDDLPNIGGYFPLMVQSGSMSGFIEVGDLIICQTVDESQNLEFDDVITFWDGAPGGTLVTHRIVEVTEDEDGNLAYITKGDANNTVDAALVYPENIVGIYKSRIPHLGDVALFMQTIPGLIICIFVPLVLFVIYDTIRRKRIDKNAKEEAAELLAELDRLKKENAAIAGTNNSSQQINK